MAQNNVGKATVEIHADTSHLSQEIKDAFAREPNSYTIDINFKVDEAKLKAQLDKLASEHIDITVNVNLDDAAARAKLDKLRAEALATPIIARMDADTSRARESIDKVAEDTRAHPVRIAAEAETASLASSITRAVENINNSAASQPVLRPRVDGKQAEKEAEGLKLSAILDLFPKIPDEAMKGLQGLGYSLLGAIKPGTYLEIFSEIAGGFEMSALKADLLITKFGLMGDAAIGAAGGVLSLSRGITDLLGLGALAPATITSYASAMVVLRDSFTKFGQAMNGNKQAMATFPPDVQKIITQLGTLNKDFSMPIKSAFWTTASESLLKVAKDDLPVVRDAFTEEAKQFGNIFDQLLVGFDKWIQGGGFKTAFDNINQGWANAAKAILPFSEALDTLTTVGSQYLPKFGDYVTDLANRFKNFIDNAAATGQITVWIDKGVAAFKNIWGIGTDVIKMFNSLTASAQLAGFGGLQQFKGFLDKLAEGMNKEPFKTQFVHFLSQVKEGSDALYGGIEKVVTSLAKMSAPIGDILKTVGKIGGDVLNGLSDMFSNTRLLAGVDTAINGMKTAADNAQPAFHNLGNAIGDLGTMAGPMVQATIDGISNIIGTASKVIANIRDGFAAAIPVFNNFMQGILKVAEGPVVQLAQTVGDMLKAFANLSPGLQNVIMWLGLTGFAVSKVIGGFKNFQEKLDKLWNGGTKSKDLKDSIDKLNDSINGVNTTAGRTGTGLRDKLSEPVKEIVDSYKNLGTSVGNTFSNMATNADNMGQHLLGTAKSVRDGFSEAFNPRQDQYNLFGEVTTAAEKMPSLVSQAVGVVKHELSTIPEGIKDISSAMKEGFGEAMVASQMTVGAGGAVIKQGFKDIATVARDDIGLIPTYMRDAGSKMATEMRPYTQEVVGFFEDIPNYMTRMGIDAYAAADKVKAAYTELADRAKVTGDTIDTAFMTTGIKIENAFNSAFTAVTDKLSAMAGSVETKVAGLSDAVMLQTIKMQNAFSGVGEKMAGLGGSIKTAAGDAVGDLGKMAGAGLTAAGKTGLGALSGIMDMFGGPWGIALGLATVALTAWADEQANAQQKVDALTGSIDKQTGAFNGAGLNQIAKDWAEIGKSGDTAGKTAQTLGLNLEGVTKTIANGGQKRTDLIKQLQDIADYKTQGDEAVNPDTIGAISGLDEMKQKAYAAADALKIPHSLIDQMNSQQLSHLVEQIKSETDAADKAKEATKQLADATGTNTANAEILAKNYQVLGDSASTAGDKFSALKQNLQIIVDSQDKAAKTSQSAARDFAQANLNWASSIENVKKENGGLVSNLYDIKTGFDFTKQAGIDFSKTLDSQRDAILQLGSDALDRAVKDGKSANDAQAAALDAMQGPIDSLKQHLTDLGFAPAQIDAIVKSLGLMPKDVTTALHVEGTDQAQVDIARLQLAAQAYASGNYEAVIAALPDAAKKAIADATGTADAFAKGDYHAIVDALNKTQGGIDGALASLLVIKNGDFSAWIKAHPDPASLAAAQAAIDAIANQRRVATIITQVDTSGVAPSVKGSWGMTSANGSIMDASGSGMFGFNPLIKHFADGGLEQHIAQIAMPGVVPRVWVEPETGGEAYIPLSPSKRSRSTQILEQVAEMFGFTLAKKLSFFDGGILQSVPRSSNLMSSTNLPTPASRTTAASTQGPSIALHVHPSQGLSEEQIGRSAATELFWQLMNRPGMAHV